MRQFRCRCQGDVNWIEYQKEMKKAGRWHVETTKKRKGSGRDQAEEKLTRDGVETSRSIPDVALDWVLA